MSNGSICVHCWDNIIGIVCCDRTGQYDVICRYVCICNDSLKANYILITKYDFWDTDIPCSLVLHCISCR